MPSRSSGRPPSGRGPSSKLRPGQAVNCRYQGGTTTYPGNIASVNSDGSYNIAYEDGDNERGVKRSFITVIDSGEPEVKELVEDIDDESQHRSRTKKGTKLLPVGTKIMAYYKGDRNNPEYPGRICRVNEDGSFDIEYDDGDKDSRIPPAMVRVPGSKKGKGRKESVKSGDCFNVGDKVFAHYKGDLNETEYPGRVTRVWVDGRLDIEYDDGDRDSKILPSAARLISVKKSKHPGGNKDHGGESRDDTEETSWNEDSSLSLEGQLVEKMRQSGGRQIKLRVGSAVKVNYKGGKELFKGVIAKIRRNGTYDIEYDDGDKESGVAKKFIHDESGRSSDGTGGINPSDEKAVIAVFDDFDRSSTGEVNRKLFKKILTEKFGLDVSKREVVFFVRKYEGADGGISYRSWAKAIAKASGGKFSSRNNRRLRPGSREESDDSIDDSDGEQELPEKLTTAVVGASVKKQLLKCVDEHDDIYALFHSLDKDGNGRLSDYEFTSGLKKLGCRLNNEQIQSLLACFDVDGDGVVSYGEFLRFVSSNPTMEKDLVEVLNIVRKQHEKLSKKKKFDMRERLSGYDEDGVGWIKPKDFKSCLKLLKFEIGTDGMDSLIAGFTATPTGKSARQKTKQDRVDYRAFAQAIAVGVVDTASVRRRLPSMILQARRQGVEPRKPFLQIDKRKRGKVLRDDFEEILARHLSLPLTAEDLIIITGKFAEGKYVDYDAFFSWAENDVSCGDNAQDSLSKRLKIAVKKLVKKSKDGKFNLRDSLSRFDDDDDGSLTRRGFLSALKQIGLIDHLEKSELRSLIEILDANRDNIVDFGEFCALAEGKYLPTRLRRGKNSGSDDDDTGEKMKKGDKQMNDSDDDNESSDSDVTRGARGTKGQVSLIAGELREMIVDEVRTLSKKQKKSTETILRKVFSEFDPKNKGIITSEDFSKSLETIGFDLTKKQEKLLRDCFDLDGDGRIDYDEFVRFVKSEPLGEELGVVMDTLRNTVRESAQTEHFGLFDDSRSMKSRVKELYKAKEANKTNEDISKLLKQYKGKDEKLKNFLKRKYKLKPPLDLHAVFSDFDKDGDGYITKKEFESGLKGLGLKISKKDTKLIFCRFCHKKREIVCYSDFVAFVDPRPNVDKLERKLKNNFRKLDSGGDLDAAFSKFDKKNKGYINGTDFRRVLGELGLSVTYDEIYALMDRFDADGNGKIDYSEFCSFARSTEEDEWHTRPLLREITKKGNLGDEEDGSSRRRSSPKPERGKKRRQKSRHTNVDDSDNDDDVDSSEGYNEKEGLEDDAGSSKKTKWFGTFRGKSKSPDKRGRSESPANTRGKSKALARKKKERGGEDSDVVGNDSDPNDKKKDAHQALLTRKVREALTERVAALEAQERKGKKKRSAKQAIEAVFMDVDKKGTGLVSSKQFQKALTKLGFKNLTSKEVKAVMQSFDLDGDGKISHREFMRFILPQSRTNTKTRELLDKLRRELRTAARQEGGGRMNVWKVFTKMDKDGNQTIDDSELGTALKRLGFNLKKKELRLIIDQYDTNGDGNVSYPELVRWLDPKVGEVRTIERKLRCNLKLLKKDGLKLRDVFEEYDVDGNDYLSLIEFRTMIEELGLALSDDEVCVLMDCFDTSGDWSKIEYDEFESFAKGRGKLRLPEGDGDSDGNNSEDSEEGAPKSRKNKSNKSRSESEEDESGNNSGSDASDVEGGAASKATKLKKGFASDSEVSSGGSERGHSLKRRNRKSKKKRRTTKNFSSDENESDNDVVEPAFDMDPAFERRLKRSFKKAFNLMDKDGSGLVSEHELGQALRAMGRDVTLKEIKRTMKNTDQNNDGKISLKEFERMMLKLVQARRPSDLLQREREVRKAFDSFDQDSSGAISKAEFKKVLLDSIGIDLTTNELKALVRAVDKDGDGEISYSEFLHLMRLAGGAKMGKGYSTKRVARELRKLKPDAMCAVQKIVRGPVRDPSEYLCAFAGMPANFRPATLCGLDNSYAHSFDAALRPSFLGSRGARSGSQIEVQLRLAKGVPVVGEVLERRARICLFDEKLVGSASEERCYVGNQYMMRADWNASEEDVWRFSTATAKRGRGDPRAAATFVVRVPDRIQGKRSDSLSLLIELTVIVRVAGGANDTNASYRELEMGCGWAFVKLSEQALQRGGGDKCTPCRRHSFLTSGYS